MGDKTAETTQPLLRTPTDTEAPAKIARQHLSRMAERMLGGGEGDELEELARAVAFNPNVRKSLAALIRDHWADHLRTEVKRFAGLMELKLLKHDPARGMSWKKGADPASIFMHIHDLMGELETAINNNQRIGLKAADIANHLMILADIAGDLDGV
jgi:NTP pyrophosphatase (non-canonical NTP hydrolase)